MMYLGDKAVGIAVKKEPSHFIRPAEWPNLNYIDYTNFEGGYFTFDLEANDFQQKWASFYIRSSSSILNCTVERGHLTNNIFVVDESYSLNGNYCRNILSPENGRIQLFRVSGTNINQISLATMTDDLSQNLHSKASPCVEIVLRLPHAKGIVASDPNHANGYYVSFTSCYTKRILLIDFGKDETDLLDFNHAFARCNNITIDVQGYRPKLSSINRIFDNATADVIDLRSFDLTNCENCGQAFYNCSTQKILMQNTGLQNPTNLDSITSGCSAIEINLTDCDFSNSPAKYTSPFICEQLIEFYPPKLGDQDYNYAGKFISKASLIRIIEALPITNANRTLTLGNSKLKLNNNELSVATEKGWTIV